MCNGERTLIEFSFYQWIQENYLMLYGITMVISLIYVYYIFSSRMNIIIRFLLSFVMIFLTFMVTAGVGFAAGSGDYIQEYRQNYHDYVLMGKETDYIRIYDVEVTNNKGNSIPKFSGKDKEKYVSINYFNGVEVKTHNVLAEPIADEREGFYISYTYLPENAVPTLKPITDVLMQMREKIGYSDVKDLVVQKGSYRLQLHVPMEQYDEYKEEMERKSK